MLSICPRAISPKHCMLCARDFDSRGHFFVNSPLGFSMYYVDNILHKLPSGLTSRTFHEARLCPYSILFTLA